MRVAHADWGVDPRKRWVAVAEGSPTTEWNAAATKPAATAGGLSEQLHASGDGTLIAGFDFPIGVPRRYAELAGIERFVDVLPLLGDGGWADFFDVADDRTEISLRRPFYPRSARVKGSKLQSDLTTALALSMDDLRRRCERKQLARAAACSLFWTLGGNQVGKGALAGWQLLQQEPRERTSIWPFDGPLEQLLGEPGVVVVETYPAEFYGHLGLPTVIGKRKQDSRAALSADLLAVASELGVHLETSLEEQIDAGFGSSSHGEDAFDAFVGLLGMLNVLTGRRPPGEPRDDPAVVHVEGWILGQHAQFDEPR